MPLTYDFKFHGMWNNRPLTMQERLNIGGYYTVRGFDGEMSLVGNRGYYWSSTPRQDGGLNAYNLYVQRDRVHVGYGDRTNAHCLWPE